MSDKTKSRIIRGLVELGRQRFDYDPDTGDLTWKDPGPEAFPTLKGYRIFKAKFVGRRAGSLNARSGYVHVVIRGRSILAHRIIWAIVYGYDPGDFIDHRDMCRSNNRLSNLREATRSQNRVNTANRADNSSGFKGVSWHKASNKWAAAIGFNGRTHLGVFATPEEAARAYAAAAEKLHGDFKNGVLQ